MDEMKKMGFFFFWFWDIEGGGEEREGERGDIVNCDNDEYEGVKAKRVGVQ